MSERPSLSIVICTFHRERLLGQALASLAAQHLPDDLSVEVIVVDNSDEQTAREIVEAAARNNPFPIRYCSAHPANISVARNAGVVAAGSEWIAFLDDDQQVGPGWLTAMSNATASGRFDVYFGAVEPVFETPDRATSLTRALFTRAPDLPAFAELFALGPKKTRGLALATNNSVFRASVLGQEPFDRAFGDGGGEDYDLICRLQQRRCRLGWLPAARATEFVPASRCDEAYLQRRFFAGGQAFAEAVAKASTTPGFTRRLLRLRALVQIALLALKYPAAKWRGAAALADHRFILAGARGKLSGDSVILPIYRTG